MTKLEELPDLAKVPQVAEVLGISLAQAWRLIWSGEVPSVRLSERVVRVPKAELMAWLERKAVAV